MKKIATFVNQTNPNMGGGNFFTTAQTNPSHTNTSGMVNTSGDGETHQQNSDSVINGRSSSHNTITMSPLIDAIHKLTSTNLIQQHISLPPIVVIGDRSSGKSSLIDSLAGIDLPRENGTCTRVPLIIKIQHASGSDSEGLCLRYRENCVTVDETNVSALIRCLTEALAGAGKGVSDVPLTLVSKRNGVPNLTIVDLPGLQIDDQSEKISDIVEKYIKLEDCLILNVIAATANLPTCESNKILKKFDKNGQRTLHVITKTDMASEAMVAMVTSTTPKPHDYICVRNRVDNESYKESQAKEADLFKTHHLLSKLDKSMVGVNVLAQKLLLMLEECVSKCGNLLQSNTVTQNTSHSHSQPNIPPLIKHMLEMFKEPLDRVRMLQEMKVLDKKPKFPEIVVLNEAFADNTSVIGTLVGLDLPSGLEVPIILNFKTVTEASRKIVLEYNHQEKEVPETHLVREITELVKLIPEESGMLHLEVTLINTQPLLVDFTVIVLPDIHTRSDCIEDQNETELFEGYLHKYWRSCDCVYLQVLSCSSEYSSSLSRKVLNTHDMVGRHTIIVFMNLNRNSITQPVFHDTFRNHFGYFFIDTGDHPKSEKDENLLEKYVSKLDVAKDHIGFDAIAKNLVTSMLFKMFRSCSLIDQLIDSDLTKSKAELKQLQQGVGSVNEARIEIWWSIFEGSTTFRELFKHQDYKKYENEPRMHAAANMANKFKRFRQELENLNVDEDDSFLKYECDLVQIRTRSWSPPFLPSGDIEANLVKWFSYASSPINTFASNCMVYIKWVMVRVLLDSAKNIQQLHPYLKQLAELFVEKFQEKFMKKIEEMKNLEKNMLFIFDDDEYNKKLEEMEGIEGFGDEIKVGNLENFPLEVVKSAFKLRKSTRVYWGFVVRRFVDHLFLYFHGLIKEMFKIWFLRVNEYLEEMVNDETELPDVESIVPPIVKICLEERINILTQVKEDFSKWNLRYFPCLNSFTFG